MKKYEAMFMVKPDLAEAETKNVFQQINDSITKHNGEIVTCGLWSEKKPLYFAIRRYREAIYYLVEFNLDPLSIAKIKAQYRMNEDILRSLILVKD